MKKTKFGEKFGILSSKLFCNPTVHTLILQSGKVDLLTRLRGEKKQIGKTLTSFTNSHRIPRKIWRVFPEVFLL